MKLWSWIIYSGTRGKHQNFFQGQTSFRREFFDVSTGVEPNFKEHLLKASLKTNFLATNRQGHKKPSRNLLIIGKGTDRCPKVTSELCCHRTNRFYCISVPFSLRRCKERKLSPMTSQWHKVSWENSFHKMLKWIDCFGRPALIICGMKMNKNKITSRRSHIFCLFQWPQPILVCHIIRYIAFRFIALNFIPFPAYLLNHAHN